MVPLKFFAFSPFIIAIGPPPLGPIPRIGRTGAGDPPVEDAAEEGAEEGAAGTVPVVLMGSEAERAEFIFLLLILWLLP